MVRGVVTIGVALALLACSGRAQTPSVQLDPQAVDSARAIVAADGDRARLSKLNPLEFMFTDQLEKTLGLTDPIKKPKVGDIVHSRIQTLEEDLIEARVLAMAQTYTLAELQGDLAFDRSPTGQALQSAAPELSRKLTSAVFDQGALAEDGPPLSAQKVALINRILIARDVEASARKGWRVLQIMIAKALSGGTKNAAPTPASANDQAETAYVKHVIAVETQFYSEKFSSEQLSELAAYFDGPIGRALAQRAPQLMSVAAGKAPKIFERLFEGMDKDACEVADCSAAQKAALDALFAELRPIMATGIDALAH